MKYNSNELRTLAGTLQDVELRFDLPGLSDEFYTATPDEFLRSPNAEHAAEADGSIYDQTIALDLSRAYFNATELGTRAAGHLSRVQYGTVNSLREMARRIDHNEVENSIDIFKAIDGR
ncbi:hypothetical protein [Actinomadura sp. DC4]|uniref:hypothetical protein n=1 Tax=Actinomadura sp. DC4 TaxID=3055069 RepID=UPI0025B03C03|nr:hypothetical protein [Actinomadura sp. DC4]MDN3357258.1 hypothetical protein [Actinomadura sp. DC4]